MKEKSNKVPIITKRKESFIDWRVAFLCFLAIIPLMIYGMAWYFAIALFVFGLLFKQLVKAFSLKGFKRPFAIRTVDKTINTVIKYLQLLEAKKPDDLKKKDYCFKNEIPYRWVALSMMESSWLLLFLIPKNETVNKTHKSKDILVTLTDREMGSSTNILGTVSEMGFENCWDIINMFMGRGFTFDNTTEEVWEMRQNLRIRRESLGEGLSLSEIADKFRGDEK